MQIVIQSLFAVELRVMYNNVVLTSGGLQKVLVEGGSKLKATGLTVVTQPSPARPLHRHRHGTQL